jgi:hypothetical protein
MTGIITSLPPPVEPPPTNTSGNPEVLGPLSYVPAIPNLTQTWVAAQTFMPGTIVLGGGTGGTSQVLKQTTLNGPVTVAQLAFSDISGTIGPIQLPAPTASTLGGVFSKAAVAHNFLTQIGTDGSISQAQPAFSDISGIATGAQLPNPSASTLGGVQSAAAVSHQWINSISTSGVPALSQPAIADISGWGTGVATALGVNVGSAGAPVLFNGAGGTPSSLTLTNATGLPLSGLANQAAWTFVFNNTSGSAAPTANTIDGLTLKASPAAADEVIIWDVAGAALKKATVSGVGASAGVASIAGNTGAFTLGAGLTNSTNVLLVDPTYFPTHLGGLILSNDGTTPNSVLDISAGAATDSTNAVIMKLAAFTKSTAGAWAAGSGSNGMGNGLTIAASTWYHVILANNGGIPDIYFDTSATGANRPAGIADTKVRRIGSFKTDASSHILTFVQVGDDFLWKASITDQGIVAQGTTATLYTLSVPPGVQVVAKFSTFTDRTGTNGNSSLYVSSPDQNDEATPGAGTAGPFSFMSFATSAAEVMGAGVLDVRTNTSAQIRARANVSSVNMAIQTYGWRDYRGKQ